MKKTSVELKVDKAVRELAAIGNTSIQVRKDLEHLTDDLQWVLTDTRGLRERLVNMPYELKKLQEAVMNIYNSVAAVEVELISIKEE